MSEANTMPDIVRLKLIPPPTDFAIRKARELRTRPTKAESLMLGLLPKAWGFAMSIPFGRYIADFLSPVHGICIECDGSSHEGREAHDRERDAFFVENGFKVIRFPNRFIKKHPQRCLDAISVAIGLSPAPSLETVRISKPIPRKVNRAAARKRKRLERREDFRSWKTPEVFLFRRP